MTNKEAIELLDSFRICVAPTLREAMSIAINALNALSVEGDTISRQAAIDALKEAFNPSITNFVKAKIAIDKLPSEQPDLPIKEKCAFCPHCNNCDVNDDLSIQPCVDTISIQAANAAICNACGMIDCDQMEKCKKLFTAQPEKRTEKRTETHACDCIERQAVEHLDRFTKIYCRDKSITDDLAFRCEKCEFEMPDKTCLVKVMARKLCPDYKDFGAMGDL